MMYRDGLTRCLLDIQRLASLNVGILFNDIYGLLYNWWAVSDSRIANSGFRVPTNDEWAEMTTYVNNTRNIAPNNFGVGNHLKSCRQISSPLGGDCDTSVHPRWDANATHYGRDTLKLNIHGAGQRATLGFSGVGSVGLYWTNSNFSFSQALIRQLSSSLNTVATIARDKFLGYGVILSRLATPTELLIPEGQIIPNYYKGNNDFLYDCVRINDRIWLAQNLAETKWSDGTLIPFAGVNGVNYSNAEWAALTTAGVCAYNNDISTWAYTLP